jgi:hypothetical protein
MSVEEERQAGGELVDVEPARLAQFDVAESVGEGERQFLRGRRARLADVVARYRQRLVGRDVVCDVFHQVADELQVRLGWVHPLLLRDVLLEDVGLQRAVEPGDVGALTFGRHDVHAEHRDGGAADRHRCRRTGQVDAVEQDIHVGRGVDRHAAMAHLADRARVV